MDSSEIRQNLVETLRLDLVGPDNDHAFANELLPESPTRWYLGGFSCRRMPRLPRSATRPAPNKSTPRPSRAAWTTPTSPTSHRPARASHSLAGEGLADAEGEERMVDDARARSCPDGGRSGGGRLTAGRIPRETFRRGWIAGAIAPSGKGVSVSPVTGGPARRPSFLVPGSATL
jgi:hypothetical protein